MTLPAAFIADFSQFHYFACTGSSSSRENSGCPLSFILRCQRDSAADSDGGDDAECDCRKELFFGQGRCLLSASTVRHDAVMCAARCADRDDVQACTHRVHAGGARASPPNYCRYLSAAAALRIQSHSWILPGFTYDEVLAD